MKQREFANLVKEVNQQYEKIHPQNMARLERIERILFGIMKCSIPSCKETTRRNMNISICWKKGLCPYHGILAGLYKKNYNTNAIPFRKRTRPY